MIQTRAFNAPLIFSRVDGAARTAFHVVHEITILGVPKNYGALHGIHFCTRLMAVKS